MISHTFHHSIFWNYALSSVRTVNGAFYLPVCCVENVCMNVQQRSWSLLIFLLPQSWVCHHRHYNTGLPDLIWQYSFPLYFVECILKDLYQIFIESLIEFSNESIWLQASLCLLTMTASFSNAFDLLTLFKYSVLLWEVLCA